MKFGLNLVRYIHLTPEVPISYFVWVELITVKDKDCLETFHRIISKDPGLIARVIHKANTIAYDKTPVASLDEAIIRLGIDELIHLIGTIAIRDLTGEGLPLYNLTQKEFNDLSMLTGYLYAEFHKECELSMGEAYSVGMLRGIGHWFIQSTIQQHQLKLAPYTGSYSNVHTWEENVLGVNHAELGAFTLMKYKLPARLLDTIKSYVRPTKASSVRRAALLRLCTDLAYNKIIPNRTISIEDILYNLSSVNKDQMQGIVNSTFEKFKLIEAIK